MIGSRASMLAAVSVAYLSCWAIACHEAPADESRPRATSDCASAPCSSSDTDGGAGDATAELPPQSPGGGGALLDAEAISRCPGVDTTQAPRLADAGGSFIVGGYAERTALSFDGVVWSADTHVAAADAAAPPVSILSIATGPNLLVAASGSGIRTSTDGKTWTPRAVKDVAPYVRYDNGFEAAAYGKGRYVVAASAKFNKLAFYSSVDGINWPDTPYVATGADCCRPIYAMVFANDKFVAVGAGRRTIVSDDGITWHDDRLPVDDEGKPLNDDIAYKEVAFGNGVWVAVGSRSIIAHSTNGIDWTDATSATKPIGDLQSLVFDGNKFVTCARAGCWSSTDGNTWTAGPDPFDAPRPTVALFHRGDLYLGLDVPAQILTSRDGLVWTPVYCAAPPQLKTIAFSRAD